MVNLLKMGRKILCKYYDIKIKEHINGDITCRVTNPYSSKVSIFKVTASSKYNNNKFIGIPRLYTNKVDT
mgnify:CR=1 FL=1|jgi:hypothetical protein